MTIPDLRGPEAPPKCRFIAQHERMENSLYLTCHGPTVLTRRGQGATDAGLRFPRSEGRRTGFQVEGSSRSLERRNLAFQTPHRDVDDLA